MSGDGQSRTVDVALTESVLSLMEGMLPEYGALGLIRQPTGGGIATAAPTNAYPSKDGDWVLIAANSNPLFARLMDLIGHPKLVDLEVYKTNQARVANADALDVLIAKWSRDRTASELIDLLAAADIPCLRVYTAEDIATDEQYRARGMVREVNDPLFGRVLHAGIVPHIPETPGTVR